MIQFTNPAFLWALTGLVIPIGIHLLSRKEGKVLRLGSLRHVQETSTQQFKGIRLNEILLLMLRCILIILFTLLISGLSWPSPANEKWVLLEKGLETRPRIQFVLDSLEQDGYELRLLADNFPLLADSITAATSINYWKLTGQLQTKNISSVIVFARNRITAFKGLRYSLPSTIRWISQSSETLSYPLQAVQLSGDSIAVRQAHTSANVTYFTTKKTDKLSDLISIGTPETISVLLVNDEKYAYDQTILKAALDAIGKSIPVNIKLKETGSSNLNVSTSADWCIWLSDKKIPATHSSNLIFLKPQASDAIFIKMKSNQWLLTRRLNEEVALKTNVTLQLAALLIPGKDLLDSIATRNDRRMLPDSIAWSAHQRVEAGLALESANPYLIVLFLVLLLIERIVAYKRNQ